MTLKAGICAINDGSKTKLSAPAPRLFESLILGNAADCRRNVPSDARTSTNLIRHH